MTQAILWNYRYFSTLLFSLFLSRMRFFLSVTVLNWQSTTCAWFPVPLKITRTSSEVFSWQMPFRPSFSLCTNQLTVCTTLWWFFSWIFSWFFSWAFIGSIIIRDHQKSSNDQPDAQSGSQNIYLSKTIQHYLISLYEYCCNNSYFDINSTWI